MGFERVATARRRGFCKVPAIAAAYPEMKGREEEAVAHSRRQIRSVHLLTELLRRWQPTQRGHGREQVDCLGQDVGVLPDGVR